MPRKPKDLTVGRLHEANGGARSCEARRDAPRAASGRRDALKELRDRGGVKILRQVLACGVLAGILCSVTAFQHHWCSAKALTDTCHGHREACLGLGRGLSMGNNGPSNASQFCAQECPDHGRVAGL